MTNSLNYPSPVAPQPGTILGPGLDGRLWKVTDTVQRPDGTSTVYVDEVSA